MGIFEGTTILGMGQCVGIRGWVATWDYSDACWG